MKITVANTEVLGREKWSTIEQGLIYWTPGKIMIVQDNEQAMLIDVRNQHQHIDDIRNENGEIGDLEEAIRAAL